ncbi:MAG TPA: M14 family zinc carboxypeptidase [Dokdonella sp.]|nr:M14 family zinc carboxypeptidase [Dokdonella sp.]
MRKTLLALAIAGTAIPSAKADHWFVEAHYPDATALARAAARFQHVRVDAERQVLQVDTDEAGIARLEADGLAVTIDSAATARLRGFEATIADAIRSGARTRNPDGYPGIPGYACYRTVEGTYQTMDDLAAAHPGIVAIDDLGPSWKKTQNAAQGYDMRALRITNFATAASDPDRPRMVVFGSIHAREYAPAELSTRFAEWLVQNYGSDPEATWLVDHNDFRLVLQANPDGRKIAEGQVYQRKNVDDQNGSCSSADIGIDLNRNFPFHWHITGDGWDAGSSGYPCDETYRGPLKQSEPETQNLVQYVAGTCDNAGVCTGGVFADRRSGPMNPASPAGDGGAAAPDDTSGFFIDIHSYAELVLWPWGDTSSPAPNQVPLRTLGRRLAWFNDYTPEQSDSLYPTDGTTDDTMYGLLGVPGFTIETDTAFFESCGTFNASTAPDNIDALRYAARTLHATYRLPAGPDAYGLAVSPVQQGAGGPYVTLTATIDDRRYNQSNGTQATYPIRAANAYVDTLPWAAGATPIALAAVDGVFNANNEAVSGTIGLTGLAAGRHLVYVQGINTLGGGNGTPGTPNAVFVDVPEAPGTVTATPQVVGAGSIDPSTPQSVASGASLAFTLTPAAGQHVGDIAGCPGSFDPPTFTAGPLLSDCTLTATFEPDQFTIGGTVAGLAVDGLVLSLNGGEPLDVPAGATSFAFPGTLPYGSSYDVTIETQPAIQACTVAHGSGDVEAAVTNVAVSCGPNESDVIFRDGFEP